MSAVPSRSVCSEDHDADYTPSCQRRAVPLAQTLCLRLYCRTGKFSGVPKCRPKKEFHFLYRLQHCQNSRFFNAKGLEDEQRHGMCNTIITVGGIDRCNRGWNPELASNVVEQGFC